ncbi:helix-turn-helix transcriptional regulator [Novosphingobium tardum]|uniref:Helix-turn-helix transcriptional regulator n=1 Tax=Novosphingobium tardum TaxID=1538021 RepID=A0ABV8RSD0_9SPHN
MTYLLRLPNVMGATGLSRAGVYSYVSKGLLPKAVKIGERASAWPESEIAAINAARIAGKSDDDIRRLVADLESQRGVSA